MPHHTLHRAQEICLISHGCKSGPITPGTDSGFFILTLVVGVYRQTISDFARASLRWSRARRAYGARLAPATHGSERRVHFGGGGELPGVAMH